MTSVAEQVKPPLEQIVKVNVPFAGRKHTSALDPKHRVHIPQVFTTTLVERQQVSFYPHLHLWYRINASAEPPHLELTDYLPNDERFPFSEYTRAHLSNNGTMTILQDDFLKFRLGSIFGDSDLIIVGGGQSMFLCKENDFEAMKAYLDSGKYTMLHE